MPLHSFKPIHFRGKYCILLFKCTFFSKSCLKAVVTLHIHHCYTVNYTSDSGQKEVRINFTETSYNINMLDTC